MCNSKLERTGATYIQCHLKAWSKTQLWFLGRPVLGLSAIMFTGTQLPLKCLVCTFVWALLSGRKFTLPELYIERLFVPPALSHLVRGVHAHPLAERFLSRLSGSAIC